jgi:hypothetical protein
MYRNMLILKIFFQNLETYQKEYLEIYIFLKK